MAIGTWLSSIPKPKPSGRRLPATISKFDHPVSSIADGGVVIIVRTPRTGPLWETLVSVGHQEFCTLN